MKILGTIGVLLASVIDVSPAPRSAAPERAHGASSLSVVVMTAGPGPRVAAILGLLRPLAQEIIVAVDDRASGETADDIASVADRVIRYPFREPVDRPLPWLFRECRCEWMLTLDDDEVPSAALLDVLPSLLEDERIVHYSLSRRWVYPDTKTYLDDAPWQPDYQLRLFRTDPRLIRFSDELHRPIVPRGPGRFVAEPIWHLDTAIRTESERRAKADRYETLRPGLRAAGRALNYAFYVPESRPDARVTPIADADRALLDLVLGAERPGQPPIAAFETVTRDEIDAHWPTHLSQQSGELEIVAAPSPLAGDEDAAVEVRVRNTGSTTWQWGRASLPTIRCAARWDGEDRTAATWTPLPSPVGPGESLTVPVHFRAPSSPGTHRLVLDLVHEGVRWLGLDVVCAIEVRPRKRVAFVGVDAAAIRSVLARDPDVEPVVVGESHGYPEAPSPAAFLLDDAPAGAIAFSTVFAWRAAQLLLAARSGRTLPRGGSTFLAALSSVDGVVAASPTAPTRRDRWTQHLAVLAARLLGIRVTRAQ